VAGDTKKRVLVRRQGINEQDDPELLALVRAG
jgi:hypothetical protein